jgi:hypothetical protein
VKYRLRIWHRRRQQGEPPFLVGQGHGDQFHKENESVLGLVVVLVVKDFGVHSLDAREAFLYICQTYCHTNVAGTLLRFGWSGRFFPRRSDS